ncbi:MULTISPECIES: Rrf2 family transcriptional regulator [unclassified Mesorhizobium]|uniref:RrF2 family transcriptional regulator n=1 Tax=unclassified Mesorhizobium TaxID=325217 RepID=UPI000FDA7F91|nr:MULTISPECIES: Rrf2 family transcriptional regulator [unclassified Mesorhizobium]TGQ42596.1 Rrf2 family transcriptional regulator [Mesorhizobium sp. M00.F.Ca.ET.216.01.1.1]TIS55404.1 MAG: Rrf2 family transcriptional regulator [Mesorhizobium sp.]TIS89986.1 MAG: Rrf2 family transcriptional regulator [Mesorhizobium sp.]TJW09571.1 MAG: Rrf2 family transcriptional regulator [Mesorhizobium sp.]TJW49014.1 MAG: Rrf2 family transcriptional regulator [Mesorhizobium sp.]
MKLSEGVEAAIHCAAMLAGVEGQGTLPGAAMAEAFGLSPSYLLKHLNALTAAGILESVPGPAGGYRLARATERITLLDIVLAIEGRDPAFRCGEIRQCGPARLDASAYAKPCGINVAMQKAERAYRAALAEARLSDIVAKHMRDADPRSVAANRAFVERHQRPQKSTKQTER